MKEKKSNKKAQDIAWEMFEQTGKIEYYELYKNLKNN